MLSALNGYNERGYGYSSYFAKLDFYHSYIH